jgi:hypothetical protein
VSDCDLTVQAYDAESGARLWSDTLSRPGDQFAAPLEVQGGRVAVLADDEPTPVLDEFRVLIRIYDLDNGDLISERATDGSPWSAALHGARLLLGGWATHPGSGHIDYSVRALTLGGEERD